MTTGVLRLRSDAYYVPVDGGVWIRTTDGSFTLRGRTVARWIERIAPLLDRGISTDHLLAGVAPEQQTFVRTLLGVLEQRAVLERDEADGVPDEYDGLFGQQIEFLRHRGIPVAAGLARVRHAPVSVAGQPGQAALVAGALLEAGFADVALLDGEPPPELRATAERYRDHGVPVRLGGPGAAAAAGRRLVGLFGPDAAAGAGRFADQAARGGVDCWLGATAGQALLLKGQLAGSALACVRCAWRRLVHPAVGLPAAAGLGHVPAAVGAAVLAQEMFQYIGTGDDARLAEAVVVDLTRLSIWRSAVDPDPTCTAPAHAAAPAGHVTGRTGGTFPAVVFAARCFGPLVACSPRELPQQTLATVRLRVNPARRDAPVAGVADSVIVAGASEAAAREEAALLAVEATAAAEHGTVVGAGKPMVAKDRALRQWATTRLRHGWTPATDQGRELVTVQCHPSGLWRAAGVGDPVWSVATDAGTAVRRAVLRRQALGQLPGDDPHRLTVASESAVDPALVEACAEHLGVRWREVALPPLVTSHLAGYALMGGDTSWTA